MIEIQVFQYIKLMYVERGEYCTRSVTFGLPGGSLGREDGRGGSGGIGLPADKGVPGRAGDEGPEENEIYLVP